MIKHLIFHSAKESFTDRVIWGTPILGHGTDQLRPINPLDPSMPTIMVASICMHEGMRCIRKRYNSIIEHCIYQLRIGRSTNIPRNGYAIKAFNNGRQVDFSCRDGKLCYIGKPFVVGLFALEVPYNNLWNFLADLPLIRVVFAYLTAFHNQLLFTHDPPYNFFRNNNFIPPQCRCNSPISIARIVFSEYLLNSDDDATVFVFESLSMKLMIVTAFGQVQLFQEQRQRIFPSQCVNNRCLLPTQRNGEEPSISTPAVDALDVLAY